MFNLGHVLKDKVFYSQTEALRSWSILHVLDLPLSLSPMHDVYDKR